MAYSIRQINDAVHSDPRGFVQESDEAYNQKIEAAARKIADNLSKSRIVLLSGPSGSGKTTTAKKIEAKLTEMGINSHAVAMDNYFKTVDLETAPRNREGQIDYESPFCMDMDLLNQHFAALDRGERILIPKFEFARQMRSDIKSQPLQLGRDEIAIFEGIHALNDIITGRNPAAAKVYISARSDFLGDGGEVAFKRTWLRLERRTVRDAKFRAWKADVTVRMWANVRRGEKLYISPFKDNASIMFDSTLPYEVSVIRAFAQPLFDHLRVSPDMDRYEEVHQLAAAYPLFDILDESFVAPDSLIREFIGGGIYDD
ncbi:MAG: nucleoside kinase [Oscillospiraceae bacterium]|jgi:uridine kinase|nr:nucleoside kinase [Oscillospiraceae bacterium]MCI8714835.1 nucleoside kinase [Oscillospiraceae bacterium]MCI9317868.1 nucleoside kinase [Oscillospiraceae bacterium]MDE6935965.1 nucleoside kinase [Oscillospiraceae bacterium]